MTAEVDARPAPPGNGEAPPPVPVARAVARVAPVVPKVWARASVPGAILAERSIGKAAVGKASLIAPPGAPCPYRGITVTPAVPVLAAPDASPARQAAPVKPDREKQRWRQRALLPVVAAIAAAFTAGTGYLAIKQPALDAEIGRWGGSRQSVAPRDAAPFAEPEAPWDASGAQDGTLTGVPIRLRVEAIGLNTSLESLGLDRKGELTPPADFGEAGWYADGTRPGDVGPAVIAGHVDSWKGPAVFYRLRELEAGDTIDVTRGGRTVRFTVTSTAWYPKTAFPTAEVYGPTPDRQLRLITCGGVFDRSLRSYEDNLVVYAVAG